MFPKPAPQYKNLDKFKVRTSMLEIAQTSHCQRKGHGVVQMKMEQIEKITSLKTRKVLPAFAWRRHAQVKIPFWQ